MSSSIPMPGRPHRRGNSIIETALVLMFVLLPLSFGAIEYSYAFYVKNTMQAAAREVARRAILPTCTTTADAEVPGRNVLTRAFDASRAAQFSINFPGNKPNTGSGNEIRVQIVSPQWKTFGVRPLGSTPLYSAAAPSASKTFEVVAVMYKE